jgi:HTH-type transcriptional regulator/antitoxin HigA
MIEHGAPYVIRDEEQFDLYAKRLFELTGKDDPTPAEMEAIELLSMLIDNYQRTNYPLPAVSPVEALRFLMDQNGMKQRDLADLLDCSVPAVSLILSGDRNLTVPHIRVLAERFHVSASVFLA